MSGMVKMRYIFVLTIVLLGLILSGCAEKDVPEEEEVVSDLEDVNAADEALSEEGAEFTDAELEDLEAELAEIEALLAEIESEENITVEEI